MAAIIENSTVHGRVTGTTNVGSAVGNLAGAAIIRNTITRSSQVNRNSGSTNVFAGLTANATVIENSGYYVMGSVYPSNATILINDLSYNEELIERGENGSFAVFIPVSKPVNTTVAENNTINTITLIYGDEIERIYLSENNAQLKYNLNVGRIALIDEPIEPLPVNFFNIQIIAPLYAMVQNSIAFAAAMVAHDVESIIVNVKTHEDATWALYSNASATQAIPDNEVFLDIGENRVFIKVTAPNGESQIITFIITRETQRPRMVTGLRTLSRQTEVQLAWDMAFEASVTGYNIYRSVSRTTGFTRIARVNGRQTLTFTDSNVVRGTQYYYRISATDTTGATSHLSSPAIMGVTLTTDAPPIITGITPLTGTSVGRRTAVNVRASDSIGLSAITLQYLENNEWITLNAAM